MRFVHHLNAAPVEVLLAKTPELRRKGFLGLLPPTDMQGIFFQFDEYDKHPFTMRGVPFSLDLICLDSIGTVVDIIPKMPPNARGPFISARPFCDALEVRGGWAEAHSLAVFDKLTYT